MKRAISVMLIAFAIAAVPAVQAQELTPRNLAAYDLPRDVHRRLTLIVDHPDTKRLEGSAKVAAGETVSGNVVAFDGPLTIEGKIEGELIVVGGNVAFKEGAVVTGDVTVIAGHAIDAEAAQIGGSLTTFGEGFELFHRGERILAVNTSKRRRAERAGWEWERWKRDWGHSTIAFRTGINYNRVEGLPILFGPVIQTGGSSPTRIEALGILRTGSGAMFATDRMGYQLRVEQFVGGSAVRLGGVAQSVVEPIERWSMSDTEASLSTFLLHEDQRDYYEREGWGVYLRVAPHRSRFDFTVGYSDEEHNTRAARDPWTLFGDGDWRYQPLIAEGNLRSVRSRIEYDGRNSDEFASAGVYLAGSFTRGLSGSLATRAATVTEADEDFSTGLLDLRLYRRVGRDATLALRGVAGGALEDRALPAQFQHALGGAGTMPGYGLMTQDCGARDRIAFRDGDSRAYFPRYGCDRFVMGSVEYRGGFDFDFGGDFDFWGHSDEDYDWRVDASPNWLLFFNAGQGWALGDASQRTNTGLLYDAGAGIVLGDFGIYAAVPLTGDRRPVNVFVRLGARF